MQTSQHFRRHITALLVLSALLTGCASTGPTMEQATARIQTPVQWQHADQNRTSSLSTANSKWWEAFREPRLNQLVESALEKNNTLASAGYKLYQAQLSAGLAQNERYPSVSGSASGSSSRSLDSSSATSTRHFSSGLSVSYTLDLWGKLAKTSSIKQWEAQASEQDLLSTQLTIEGSVSKLYWQLAYLNQRVRMGEQSIVYARKTLDLVRVQHRAGAVSKLEVITAERNLTSQEASLDALKQEREVARNAMAILFDAPPSAHISDEPQNLPNSALPSISAGIPAEVIASRPDLIASELRLRQALGNIDVARANFYPNFTLTGNIGTGSSSLSEILSNPVGSVALNLALPFLNWNENQLNLKISKAAYEQTAINHRQTVYTALQEVENALSAHALYAAQAQKEAKSLANAREAERLYEVRYRAGADSLKNWLDAQEARRQAELSHLAIRYNQYVNYIDLMLALGG